MKHDEGFFTGSSGTQIYYQSWLPDGEIKAVLIISHGLAEHGGRYMNVVNQLVPAGFAVYAHDHYGHGKSEGVRTFVPRFEEFIKTHKIFFDMLKEQHPENKFFMLGHSMGSLITARYLLDYQDELDGAIISGTSIQAPTGVSNFTIFLGNLLSEILPKLGIDKLYAEGVSRDPEVVAGYINDPLVHTDKFTARLGAEGLKTIDQVTNRMAEIKLPIFIIHGTTDPLMDPTTSQKFYDGISSEDKTLKFYEGYYHETYNDPGKEQVLEDLQAWLEDHI